MSNKRISYTAEFKAKIALEALLNISTISELCSKHELHASQITRWKKELEERSSEIFEDKRKKDIELKQKEEELEKVYKQLGKVTVENDWLKKKSGLASVGS